jgi:hypothetical protein
VAAKARLSGTLSTAAGILEDNGSRDGDLEWRVKPRATCSIYGSTRNKYDERSWERGIPIY